MWWRVAVALYVAGYVLGVVHVRFVTFAMVVSGAILLGTQLPRLEPYLWRAAEGTAHWLVAWSIRRQKKHYIANVGPLPPRPCPPAGEKQSPEATHEDTLPAYPPASGKKDLSESNEVPSQKWN